MTNRQFCIWFTYACESHRSANLSEFLRTNIYVKVSGCVVVRRSKVLRFQGHTGGLFYQHHPSETVRGLTLLSATEGLSSFARSVLSVHVHTQSSTKAHNHTDIHTHTQARTEIYYTHINNLSAVTQREGAFRLRLVSVMRQPEEEHSRRTAR